MEPSIIFDFLKDHPIWGGFILFIVYVFIFGDRKQWEYEVKFPKEPGVGRGEVELESFKKKGSQIELHFDLDPVYHHKPIEIFRKGISIYTVESHLNTGKRVFIKSKTKLEKPDEGDEIIVKIDGKPVFTGRLVLD